MTVTTTSDLPTISDLPTKLESAPNAKGATGAWSIGGWCVHRGYSIATFYKMKKNGTAPAITHPPGTNPRITVEADQDWLKFCQNLPPEMVAQVAARSAERRDRTRKAGAAGVLSPLHISNAGPRSGRHPRE